MMTQPSVSKNGFLLTNALVIPGAHAEPLSSGAIMIRSGQIEAIGPSENLVGQYPQLSQVDMQGYLIAPGMINAHTHSSMGFFRSLGHAAAHSTAEDMSTMIERFFYPAEKALSAELIEPLAYSYLVDTLRSGVTCVGDAYFYASGVAKACDRLGMRGFIGEHIADLGGAVDAGLDYWQKTKSWLETWNYSSRVMPMVYAHATDTVSLPLLQKLGEYARYHQLPFHMHLSQSDGEYDRVQKRCQINPVAYAKQAGVLGPQSLLVHLVSAKEDELAVLRDSGSTAVICPVSEMIYERLPDLATIETLGIPVCLGTDSPASNDGADLLAELRIYGLLLKDRGLDSRYYHANRLLQAVTSQAAKSYGLPNLGELRPGYLADLVCYQLDLGCLPATRPLETLIYSMGSRQVSHVMIDGEWVLWNRELARVNERELTAEYLSAVSEIKKRSSLP
ncbi:MAG: amidohydrolase family protein [Oligoflexus sp.]